ncbi:hypothetical protein JI435_408010 [Parastagonospora nodorum SN15]|uniref:Uncharacterized protein n=1 Tax=Phaeosphaeria nodorum (strain SN15 / ATCC MYA-4574 / FGSC 10173) TaxID=321614 RepID=A0A7U2EZ96_PHANO|nr:hypothetical protein JI435_408010 [Parastagonospora nodorum SN15]
MQRSTPRLPRQSCTSRKQYYARSTHLAKTRKDGRCKCREWMPTSPLFAP